MRPWTVLVLSDYGRDRLVYQAPEQTFDPTLPPRYLPVQNRHVLRMQAVYCLFDWLAQRGRAAGRALSVWWLCTEPVKKPAHREQQMWLADRLQELLEQPRLAAELLGHVREALEIGEDEALRLFWEPPRALLTTAVPTLLRRLRSGWAARRPDGSSGLDLVRAFNPLPDFVPGSLFADLQLPELAVRLPAAGRAPAGVETMPLLQGMQTLAPGRVTRRFASVDIRLSHWVPISDTDEQALSAGAFCPDAQELGAFDYLDEAGQARRVRCLRPYSFVVERCPEQRVSISSNSFWRWRTQIFAEQPGEPLELYPLGRWAAAGLAVEAHTHTRLNGVTVRRFSEAADASYRPSGGNSKSCLVRLVEGGVPVALGFDLAVDGLRLRYRLPERLLADDFWAPELLRVHRPLFFQHRVRHDEALTAHANVFQLGWLAEVHLAALVRTATLGRLPLEEAALALAGDYAARTGEVLDRVLQLVRREEDDEESCLRADLEELLGRPAVRAALLEAEQALWRPPDEALRGWLIGCFRATLGGVFREACCRVAPQVEAGDLLLDLDGGVPPGAMPRGEEQELWITEASPGGTGVVEEVRRRILESPPRFVRMLEDALAPAEMESIDADLTRLAREAARAGSALSAVAERVRRAGNQAELEEARRELLGELARTGHTPSRPLLVALNARLFPAGSGPAHDALLTALLDLRDRVEADLGIEVGHRELAFLASEDAGVTDLLARAVDGDMDGPARYRNLAGLLWPRASLIRATALQSYNPFRAAPAADRRVLLRALADEPPLPADTTAEAVRERLAATGSASIKFGPDERGRMRALLIGLSAEGLPAGYLHVYPEVWGVRREDDGHVLVLQAREVLP
jgi:hypothetical protein